MPDPAAPIPPSQQPARLDALEAAVRARSDLVPEVGIVLGSGLGGLADELEDAVAIPFAELPGWPAATAPGLVGRLLLGRLGGRVVVMLQGRFHLYEGNAPGLVVQPVLLFRRLGAQVLVLTNASGGLNPSFGPGTLMVIRDHLNLTGQNPLIGPNADGDHVFLNPLAEPHAGVEAASNDIGEPVIDGDLHTDVGIGRQESG